MGDSDVLNTDMSRLIETLMKELCNLSENEISIRTSIKRIGELKELPRDGVATQPLPQKTPETYLDKINAAIIKAQTLNEGFNFILTNLNRMV